MRCPRPVDRRRDRAPRDGIRTVVSSQTTRCPPIERTGPSARRKKRGSNSQGADALGGFQDRCRRRPSACSSVMGCPGIEPGALRLRAACSAGLSFHPAMAKPGIEPGPPACETGALPGELLGPYRADDRNRTGVLLAGNEALDLVSFIRMAGTPGFEPGPAGLEPAMLCVTPRPCGVTGRS